MENESTFKIVEVETDNEKYYKIYVNVSKCKPSFASKIVITNKSGFALVYMKNGGVFNYCPIHTIEDMKYKSIEEAKSDIEKMKEIIIYGKKTSTKVVYEE